ncbi:tyrosine-protein kinase receptor TYRO3 [Pimephales promelas]|nr:tyrosine-protein kinase receptor TYRO3 [Pimephales promelas]
MGLSLWILLLLLHFNEGIHGVRFTKNPSNQTVTQGNMARLGCAFEGLSEPEIIWMKDGEKIYSTDQMYITLDAHHWETFHSVKSVQQQDAGKYWCEVEYHGTIISSEPAWITVEGVPHFVEEQEDVAVFAGEPFNLTCAASGPPEPVVVLWWLGDQQNGDFMPSPSVLLVKGVNESVKFYCEAKNARGISVSRTGTVHIKVRPDSPRDVKVHHVSDLNITVTWSPGFTGHSQLSSCTIQVSKGSGKKVKLPDLDVVVPPFQHVFGGLHSYSNYSVRIRCDNEVGSSPFSPWVDFHTPEAAPSAAPKNFTFELSEQQLTLSWAALEQEELCGRLLAYKVQWNQGGENQDPLLFKDNIARLSGAGRFFNATFQVAACTNAGCGPWSQTVLVMPMSAMQAQTQRGHIWVGLLFGLLVATMVGLLLIVLVRNRGKETQFGSAFAAPGTEVPVSFTAARSFNRQFPELPETTLDSLGISSDLKAKLQDVLISERLLTLGRMLGKGVSLHRRAQQRLPVPMVILPFMKHGDLHTFLLMSRLGDEPFTLSQQMLIQFMLDIARGMEYLSNKNIIHRDLAARNCMLNENMSVCVADFGLSKKIYSGDYYRQGSVSKLPVKWIALESLADNVYTTQSDVWAFGVTMWEIMTRGQTPYPGVENSEIYEYLIKGERLKQPPDCPGDVYEIMHSCWSPVPKCRPSFQHLIDQLELLWAKLNPAPVKEPLLYVNLEEEDGEQASAPGADVGTRSIEDPSWGVPWQCAGIEEDEKDWLMVSSGAAFAIGGDYRYIIGPRGGGIDEESRRSDDGLSEDIRDEEEDIIINV